MTRVFVVGLILGASGLSGCGSDGTESGEAVGAADAGGGAGGATSSLVATGSGADGVGGERSTSSADGSGGAGGAPTTCGCLLGEGPYCAGRIEAEAQKAGCATPFLDDHAGDLMKCEGDVWSVLEACDGACAYDAASGELDDACVLPACDCFVQVAWCGSGAAKKADELGCQIPLLPEHDGDILHCPGGAWTVKQSCELGCVEAPEGTPDFCKSDAEYRLPFDCDVTRTCSNGNHTSSHAGKDEYAYDFATPVGTPVHAMRAGTVLRVRNITGPGDPCYAGGGSSCANFANTVEVAHSDGTVALYMHLSEGTVSAGDPIAQGDPIGLSGNTGYSTGPHVHVQVQESCGIWWCQSQPFAFAEDPSISSGEVVTSQNCPDAP